MTRLPHYFRRRINPTKKRKSPACFTTYLRALRRKNSGDIFSSYPGFLANYFVQIAFGAAVDRFRGLNDPILGIK